MIPFAFQQNGERPGRTCQGFAIKDRRAARAPDRTCSAAKTNLEEGEGRAYERIPAVNSLTTSGPFNGGRSEISENSGPNSSDMPLFSPTAYSGDVNGTFRRCE